MADEQKQQLYRSSEASARGSRSTVSPTGGDPLAELARLIGQTDPFAEFDRQNARRPTAPPAPPAAPPPNFGPADYFDAPAAPPHPASLQPSAYAPPPLPPGRARQPYAAEDLYPADNEVGGHSAGEHGDFDPPAYHPSNAPFGAEEEGFYEDGHLPKRRMGVMAIAVVFALAVIGTAGAFGYRAIFGGSHSSSPPPVIKADTQPSKIVPAAASKTPNKLIYDRVGDHSQDEKLVSREEKPVEINSAAIKTNPDVAVAHHRCKAALHHSRRLAAEFSRLSLRKCTPSPSARISLAWAPTSRRQPCRRRLRWSRRFRSGRRRRKSPAIILL